MVWLIKTWINTTRFTGILSSEHLQLCFRTTGAYFVFVSRQIKEEFKVQSKSHSPPPRDSDDSPPPLHPDKLSASCPPFWHCKQSLSDLAKACKCAPSCCAHGSRRSARSWWTSSAAHTQTHSLAPFLPHLPWSQGPAATQPLDSLTIECSLYPSSRLLTHHTFSIISNCSHRCMAATASLSIISAVTFHPSPWYSLTTIRCFVYLWPLALQWRELWTGLQSQTGWLRPHCHYSWLVQQDLEDTDMERELFGLFDHPRNQFSMLLQSKRFVFQGTPEMCCVGGKGGVAPAPVIEVELTIGTLESAVPGRGLEFRDEWGIGSTQGNSQLVSFAWREQHHFWFHF